MTIVEFLRARLDEDEAAARGCAGAPWSVSIPGQVHVDAKAIADNKLALGKLGYVATVLHEHDRKHIVRHDPARVLREVEAKRRLIDSLIAQMDEDFAPWNEINLRIMAEPFADHPDYDTAWSA